MTDGSVLPLRTIPTSDYSLSVDSLEATAVAFAPRGDSPHPRVIALSPASGPLMKVTLELPSTCHKTKSSPMGAAYVYMSVKFPQQQADFPLNDGTRMTANKVAGLQPTSR